MLNIGFFYKSINKPVSSHFISLAVNATLCNAMADQTFLKNYLYVLLLGQALNGFGGTCLYSIGVTYLDESVSAKVSPLYIGQCLYWIISWPNFMISFLLINFMLFCCDVLD